MDLSRPIFVGLNAAKMRLQELKRGQMAAKRQMQAVTHREQITRRRVAPLNVSTFEAFEHEPGVWRDQASCDAPHRAPMKAIAAVLPVLHLLNTAQQCLMYNCAPACVQLPPLPKRGNCATLVAAQ